MSPTVAYLIAIGGGLILAVVLVEWAEAKERARRASSLWDDEFKALMAARDVTGRIPVNPKRWE